MPSWPQLVRCLLVVAAWQGPLPVVHSHGTSADAPDHATVWLLEHLASAHADVAPTADLPLGWHLHLAFPTDDGEAPEDASVPSRSLVIGDAERADVMSSIREPALVSTWELVGGVSSIQVAASRPRPGATQPPGGFFTTFAADMPLPVRLGVLRC